MEPKDLTSVSLKHQAAAKLEEEPKAQNVEGTGGGDENKQSIQLACSSKQHCVSFSLPVFYNLLNNLTNLKNRTNEEENHFNS